MITTKTRCLSMLWLALTGCGGDERREPAQGTDTGSSTTQTTEVDQPSCEVDLQAPVLAGPPWIEADTPSGRPYLAWAPAEQAPRAIVFMFHGTGGGLDYFYTPHLIRIEDEYHRQGFAFVVSESEARGTDARWDRDSDREDNPDWANLVELRDELIATTSVTEQTPIIAWGLSNGGVFTRRFVEMAEEADWPVVGQVAHIAAPRPGSLPTLFVGAENDTNIPDIEQTVAEYDDLDIRAEFLLHTERDWVAEDMLFHPGYDRSLADEVFAELVAEQILDDNGVRQVALTEGEAVLEAYKQSSTLVGAARVTLQLETVWATHRVTARYACEELDFVASLL